MIYSENMGMQIYTLLGVCMGKRVGAPLILQYLDT